MDGSSYTTGRTPHGELYSIFPHKYPPQLAIIPLRSTQFFLALTDEQAEEYTGKLLAAYGSGTAQYQLTCDTWEQAGRFLAWIEAAYG